jgi:biotin carboxyl carrier protein
MVKRNSQAKVDVEESSKSNYKILVIEGTKFRTNFHRKYETKAKWVAANPKEMLAFIPGTVIKINVKPGQHVKQGDLLVIFEAMKMNNRIIAPFDGVIKDVYAKAGERVAKGFKIVDFE